MSRDVRTRFRVSSQAGAYSWTRSWIRCRFRDGRFRQLQGGLREPPKQLGLEMNVLWRLQKIPYGIPDAERQCLLAVEEWMLNWYGLQKVTGVQQPAIGGTFRFNGCEAVHGVNDGGAVEINMGSYIDKLKPIHVSKLRMKEWADKCTEGEIAEYRAISRTLKYLGKGVLPQACYVTSRMQLKLEDLRVRQIILASEMLKDLNKLTPAIMYSQPSDMTSVRICSISNTSHGGANNIYEKTGNTAEMRIRQIDRRFLWFGRKE